MPIEDEIAFLSALPILSELDEEALRVLAFSTDTRNLNTGEILLRRGERSDGGYFVLSGALSISRTNSEFDQADVIKPGGLIGEMAMIAVTENQVTAVASEPTTVLRIPRPLFQRVLREYPGSAARLKSAIEKRLVKFAAELESLRQKSLEG